MQRRFFFGFPYIHLRRSAYNLPHDPTGLLEKGRAEENVYFRKKEQEELYRLRQKLERLERTQNQLQDKLEKAQELLDEMIEAKNAEKTERNK